LPNSPLGRSRRTEKWGTPRSRGEVFLTVDQGIEYQQNLTARKIAIIIFRTKSNRLKDLLPHVPACLAHIESIRPGQIVRIER
jgi:hypothetical protein